MDISIYLPLRNVQCLLGEEKLWFLFSGTASQLLHSL